MYRHSARHLSLSHKLSKRSKIKKIILNRVGEQEFNHDEITNQSAETVEDESALAIYGELAHTQPVYANVFPTKYGVKNSFDTMGNYLYSNQNRINPYDSFELINKMPYKAPRTQEEVAARNEELEKNIEEFDKNFGAVYDSSSIRKNWMKNLQKLTSKITGSSNITENLYSKDIESNFWKRFLVNSPYHMFGRAECWDIYERAHQAMKRENWGNQVNQVGKEALDGLTAGPFKHKILKEVENATIEWELVEINSGSLKEPVILSLDVSDSRYEAADGTKYTFATVRLQSKQRLKVWDRMGNPVIEDQEPRDVDEIVTFVHMVPDPSFRGWLIWDKENYSGFQIPNSNKTTIAARQKEIVDEADKFLKEEMHSSYNHWSGDKDYLHERRREYYHRGWNYGGTQESESIAGEGGLEHQMRSMMYYENKHPSMAKKRLLYAGLPMELDGTPWELHLKRKRALIHYKRESGDLPKKNYSNVWSPKGRRPT